MPEGEDITSVTADQPEVDREGEAMAKKPGGSLEIPEHTPGTRARAIQEQSQRDKEVAITEFLATHCQKVRSTGMGDASVAPGMLGWWHTQEGALQPCQVLGVRLVMDPLFDRKRPSMPIFLVRGADGTEGEVWGVTPAYRARDLRERKDGSLQQLEEAFPGQRSIQFEDGSAYTVGDRLLVNTVEEYVGWVAMIPPQDKYPGQLGVFLRDARTRGGIYLVSHEFLTRLDSPLIPK